MTAGELHRALMMATLEMGPVGLTYRPLVWEYTVRLHREYRVAGQPIHKVRVDHETRTVWVLT